MPTNIPDAKKYCQAGARVRIRTALFGAVRLQKNIWLEVHGGYEKRQTKAYILPLGPCEQTNPLLDPHCHLLLCLLHSLFVQVAIL